MELDRKTQEKEALLSDLYDSADRAKVEKIIKRDYDMKSKELEGQMSRYVIEPTEKAQNELQKEWKELSLAEGQVQDKMSQMERIGISADERAALESSKNEYHAMVLEADTVLGKAQDIFSKSVLSKLKK